MNVEEVHVAANESVTTSLSTHSTVGVFSCKHLWMNAKDRGVGREQKINSTSHKKTETQHARSR